jgi:hypothetical protein
LIAMLVPTGKLPALVEIGYFTNSSLLASGEVLERAEHFSLNMQGVPVFNYGRPTPGLKIAHHNTWNCTVAAEETEAWVNSGELQNVWFKNLSGEPVSGPKRVLPGKGATNLHTVSLLLPVFHPDLAKLRAEHPHLSGRDFNPYRLSGVVVATYDWQSLLDTAMRGEDRLVGFDTYAGNSDSPDSFMGRLGVPNRRGGQSLRQAIEWPFHRNAGV